MRFLFYWPVICLERFHVLLMRFCFGVVAVILLVHSFVFVGWPAAHNDLQ